VSEPAEPAEIAEYEQPARPVRDGIGEEDHPIPLWFHLSFLGTIVFAVVYVVYYAATGWSAVGQWADEVARFEAAHATAVAAVPEANPFKGDAAAIADGQQER